MPAPPLHALAGHSGRDSILRNLLHALEFQQRLNTHRHLMATAINGQPADVADRAWHRGARRELTRIDTAQIALANEAECEIATSERLNILDGDARRQPIAS